MKKDHIYLNRKIIIQDHALIPVKDPGLLFGHGLFETVRVYNHAPFLLEEHLQRLFSSAPLLGVALPLSMDDMIKEISRYIKYIGLDDGALRITVTKGLEKPNLIFAYRDTGYLKEDYQNGFSLKTVSTKRNPRSVTSYHKTLNYLDNILAKEEAHHAGYNEALLLNTNDKLSECASSNIFFVKNDHLYTPLVTCGLLNGITRQFIINELAGRLDLEVTEGEYGLNDLYSADEVFITNSVIEIMPVRKINNHFLKTNAEYNTKKLSGIYKKYIYQKYHESDHADKQ